MVNMLEATDDIEMLILHEPAHSRGLGENAILE